MQFFLLVCTRFWIRLLIIILLCSWQFNFCKHGISKHKIGRNSERQRPREDLFIGAFDLNENSEDITNSMSPL